MTAKYTNPLAPYDGFCFAYSYGLVDFSKEIVFQWLFHPNLKVNFSTPTVIYNGSQQRENLIMLLKLENKNFATDTVNFTFIVNANKDDTINWIDTIDVEPGFSYNRFSPVHYGDDVFFISGKKMYSYDYASGDINWSNQVDGNHFSKVVVNGDDLYAIISQSEFMKVNPNTGEVIWKQIYGRSPSVKGGFELHKHKIVYSGDGFGQLIVLNNSNGEIETINNSITESISNPKLYKKDGIFITHSINEIIAFEIIE